MEGFARVNPTTYSLLFERAKAKYRDRVHGVSYPDEIHIKLFRSPYEYRRDPHGQGELIGRSVQNGDGWEFFWRENWS